MEVVPRSKFRSRKIRIPFAQEDYQEHYQYLLPKVTDEDFSVPTGYSPSGIQHLTRYVKTSWDSYDGDTGTWVKDEDHHNYQFEEQQWGYNHIVDETCCWTVMRQVENVQRTPLAPQMDPEVYKNSATGERVEVRAACCVGDIGNDSFFAPFSRPYGYTEEWGKKDSGGEQEEDRNPQDDIDTYTAAYFPTQRHNFNFHNIRDVGCCNVHEGHYDKNSDDEPQWDLHYTEDTDGCTMRKINAAIGFGVAGLIFSAIMCVVCFQFFCQGKTFDKSARDTYSMNTSVSRSYDDPYKYGFYGYGRYA